MTSLQKALAPVFAGAGVLHFLTPAPFDSIVPPRLPGAQRFYTYASGVAELATAALLANTGTRKRGGVAAAALLTAVWPANIYMAWQWRRKPLPLLLGAVARVPLQIPLIRAALALAK